MSRAMKRAGIIVVGLGIVAGLAIEGSARFRIEARYQRALRAQRQLEDEFARLKNERDRLFEVVKLEQKRAEQFSDELAAKDKQMQGVLDRLAEEDLVVNDLQAQLKVVQRHADRMEEELVLALGNADTSGSPKQAIRLERVIVTPPGASASTRGGRVVSVHPDWKFIVVSLGWDSVNIGDVVSIYRNEQLLGKARIERVQQEAAAATLLPEWRQAEVRVDDIVRAL